MAADLFCLGPTDTLAYSSNTYGINRATSLSSLNRTGKQLGNNEKENIARHNNYMKSNEKDIVDKREECAYNPLDTH